MAGALVGTKLLVPRQRAGLVARPRLTSLLIRGFESKLTLVSAPAGFGKTTLLASGVAEAAGDRAVAWLSLDGGDNSPVRFWTSVITAVSRVAPGVGAESLSLLQAAQPPTAAVVA